MDKTTLMYTKAKSIDISTIYNFIVEEFDAEAELSKDSISGYVEHNDGLMEERYDKIYFNYCGKRMGLAIISNYRTNDLKRDTGSCSVTIKNDDEEKQVTRVNGLEFDSQLCNVIALETSEISKYILTKIASYFGGGYMSLE